MPKLTMASATKPAARSQAAGTASAAAGSGSGSGGAKPLLLTVAAAAMAVTAAAAYKWQPWSRRSLKASVLPITSLLRLQQRRRQRDLHSSEEDDGEELLAAMPGGQAGQLRRRQPQALELVPGRARMKALVQRQMGGSAAPTGGWEQQLVAGGTLPQDLAHRLNGGRDPNGEGQLASGGSRGSSSSGGHVPVVVRQWGLETDSLRMSISDLQVGGCYHVML